MICGNCIGALVAAVCLPARAGAQPDPQTALWTAIRNSFVPPAGGAVEFAGVAVAFSAEPFMLTFDADLENLRGLPFARPPSKDTR